MDGWFDRGPDMPIDGSDPGSLLASVWPTVAARLERSLNLMFKGGGDGDRQLVQVRRVGLYRTTPVAARSPSVWLVSSFRSPPGRGGRFPPTPAPSPLEPAQRT